MALCAKCALMDLRHSLRVLDRASSLIPLASSTLLKLAKLSKQKHLLVHRIGYRLSMYRGAGKFQLVVQEDLEVCMYTLNCIDPKTRELYIDLDGE